jgi:hypothetical protein
MNQKEMDKVIRCYKKYGNCVQMQNHFPTLSVRSIQRRVKALKEMGLL